jgi:Transglycosylase SLT domain
MRQQQQEILNPQLTIEENQALARKAYDGSLGNVNNSFMAKHPVATALLGGLLAGGNGAEIGGAYVKNGRSKAENDYYANLDRANVLNERRMANQNQNLWNGIGGQGVYSPEQFDALSNRDASNYNQGVRNVKQGMNDGTGLMNYGAKGANIGQPFNGGFAGQGMTPTPRQAVPQSPQGSVSPTTKPSTRAGGGYGSIVNKASQLYGIDPALLHAVIRQESGGNPKAKSPVGAMGMMQLMPATAKALGVIDPSDPEQNIMGGAKYLAQHLKTFGGNVPLALAAYNAGPGAVQKYKGIPPYKETQNYVKSITANMGKVGSMPQVGQPTATPQSTPAIAVQPQQADGRLAQIPIPAVGNADIMGGKQFVSPEVGKMLLNQYNNGVGAGRENWGVLQGLPAELAGKRASTANTLMNTALAPQIAQNQVTQQQAQLGLGYAQLGQQAGQFQQTNALQNREVDQRGKLLDIESQRKQQEEAYNRQSQETKRALDALKGDTELFDKKTGKINPNAPEYKRKRMTELLNQTAGMGLGGSQGFADFLLQQNAKQNGGK